MRGEFIKAWVTMEGGVDVRYRRRRRDSAGAKHFESQLLTTQVRGYRPEPAASSRAMRSSLLLLINAA